MKLELESSCEHRKHGSARIRGRNSNTQLVRGFNDVLIII